jgi:hypothetical protein
VILELMRATIAAAAVLAATAPAAADTKLPPHYAALFEKGRHWTYDVTLTKYDDSPASVTKQQVTCTVTEVGDVPTRGKVSKLTCTPHLDAEWIEHAYYASESGLALIAADAKLPTTAAELDDAIYHLGVVPAKPKAVRTVTKAEPSINPKGVDIEGVRAEGDGWCTFHDSSTADPDGEVRSECFHGSGITSGDFHSLNKLYKIVYKLAAPR